MCVCMKVCNCSLNLFFGLFFCFFSRLFRVASTPIIFFCPIIVNTLSNLWGKIKFVVVVVGLVHTVQFQTKNKFKPQRNVHCMHVHVYMLWFKFIFGLKNFKPV